MAIHINIFTFDSSNANISQSQTDLANANASFTLEDGMLLIHTILIVGLLLTISLEFLQEIRF